MTKKEDYQYAVAEPVSPSDEPPQQQQQQQQQLVQVVAPSTLEAGYTFLVEVNSRTISVTVPKGGVKEGQTFTVPVTVPSAPIVEAAADRGNENTPLTSASPYYTNSHAIPRGGWKDGLCACCKYGPFHPHLWNAWCFPQILMAQVLTRMNMSWLGKRNSSDFPKTFKRILWIVIVYWVLYWLLKPPQPVMEIEGDDATNYEVHVIEPDVPLLQKILFNLLNTVYLLYSLVVLIKLRRAVRDRYSIPNQCGPLCNDDLEDCCCACMCGCCVVAQLARHTADYQERRALCCSSTGLPPSPPTVMVV